MKAVRQAFLLLTLTSVLLGIVYPLALTGVAQVAMPKRAGGSPLVREGRMVASKSNGESFGDPFGGRVSATGPVSHVRPEAVYYQAGRTARERNLDMTHVETLTAAHIEGRTLGILGQPRVNVLLLNLSLENLQ